MKKKQIIHMWKIGIFLLIAVVVCMGCGSGNKADEKKNKELEKLMEWNPEEEYPDQPVEVAQLYCSLTKEIHAKDISKEQIEQLLKKMRQLFDEELLKGNPYPDHLDNITREIKQYQKDNTVINRYTVEEAGEVETYIDENGSECGTVDINYTIKKGSQWLKSREQLIIRKDSDGRWRILGNRTAS